MDRAARIAFMFAALLSFAMGVMLHPPQIPGQPSDKIMHMLAFATLGGLAAYGYRSVPLALLFAGLSAFGALIEGIQAIPALNRDSDTADLAADMVAALVALVVTRWAVARRGRRKR